MKVLHVCPYMHPAAGGPAVVVERYCQHSPDYGWDAHVISTSLYCEDDGSELRRSLEGRLAIDILPVDHPRLWGLSSRLRAVIDASVGSSDIVHVHTLWHPLGAIVRQACAKHGCPYVTMPHGMLDRYSLNVNPWRKRLYMFVVERANLQGASRMVYTTPEEQRLAEESLPWLPPGSVSPLGADDPPRTARRDLQQAFLARFPDAFGRRCLLFLGRLHHKKGLDRILEILPALVERFPEVLLIVAGAGEAAYVEQLGRCAKADGLNGNVLLTGMLQGKLKWGAFASAEMFLLPSRQENFAISVAEAMWMGLPVVITDRVNLWPYVAETRAGLVIKEADLALDLPAALISLLENRDEAQHMGKRGKAFASSRFLWSRSTQKIIDIYKDVLKL